MRFTWSASATWVYCAKDEADPNAICSQIWAFNRNDCKDVGNALNIAGCLAWSGDNQHCGVLCDKRLVGAMACLDTIIGDDSHHTLDLLIMPEPIDAMSEEFVRLYLRRTIIPEDAKLHVGAMEPSAAREYIAAVKRRSGE